MAKVISVDQLSSSHVAIDAALITLSEKKHEWAKLDIDEVINILNSLKTGFIAVAEKWVELNVKAKSAPSAEEWLAGPYLILKYLNYLAISLEHIAEGKIPYVPGKIKHRPSGKLALEVFPVKIWDSLLFNGISAELWLNEKVSEQNLSANQAKAYTTTITGKVVAVLSAGNVSSIGPLDLLTKMFVERKVVIFKLHPINSYLYPLLERALRRVIEEGYLRIILGDAEVGKYVVEHNLVDEIHLTGAESTFYKIVFGNESNRLAKKPIINKKVTAELGNVSPVVVVPEHLSEKELLYQAENIVSMFTNNASFNCNAARVIVTEKNWPYREKLLTTIKEMLSKLPPRKAYYPGAHERFSKFADRYLNAYKSGDKSDEYLPWTFATDLDPEKKELAFSTESFCPFMAETSLQAKDKEEFLAKSIDFINKKIYGSLNVTFLIKDKTIETIGYRRFTEHLERVRYGTVSLNSWAALGFALGVTTWGAYPGNTLDNVESGIGFVHNALMFENIEKSVIFSPYIQFPKPPWFPFTHNADKIAKALFYFEAYKSPLELFKIIKNYFI